MLYVIDDQSHPCVAKVNVEQVDWSGLVDARRLKETDRDCSLLGSTCLKNQGWLICWRVCQREVQEVLSHTSWTRIETSWPVPSNPPFLCRVQCSLHWFSWWWAASCLSLLVGLCQGLWRARGRLPWLRILLFVWGFEVETKLLLDNFSSRSLQIDAYVVAFHVG